jgi:hypothetical protein
MTFRHNGNVLKNERQFRDIEELLFGPQVQSSLDLKK